MNAKECERTDTQRWTARNTRSFLRLYNSSEEAGDGYREREAAAGRAETKEKYVSREMPFSDTQWHPRGL